MSEDISAGVRILLERGKTNPDEMKEEFGQWAQLREAVFEYKENKRRNAWIRGLTEKEIDALYEMFNLLYRDVFDAWVMKTVLGAGEEEAEVQRKLAHSMAANKVLINNPQMLQNSIPPGSWQNVATQTSNTSITASLKSALGIK